MHETLLFVSYSLARIYTSIHKSCIAYFACFFFCCLFVDGIFTTTPETRETSEYVNFINKPLRMNSILLSYSSVFSSCVFSHSYGSTAKYYLFCLLWAHTKSVEYKHTRRRATTYTELAPSTTAKWPNGEQRVCKLTA